jgi:hypothetical protein
LTATFSPASVTAGGMSTLTLSTPGNVAAGTYSVNVNGTGSSAVHSVSVAVTIAAPVVNDFSIAVSPASLSLAKATAGSSAISTAVLSGAAETIALSVSGVPVGATAGLSAGSVGAGGSATLNVDAGTAEPGSYTLTVTGTAASATHIASLSLTIVGPTCQQELASCQGDRASCHGDLSTCQGGLSTCQGGLSICRVSLTTCQGDLTASASALSSCRADLATSTQAAANCNASLSTSLASLNACQGNLGACRTGAADTDADGIPDRLDHCAGTPAGVSVDAEGCSLTQFCARIDASTPKGLLLCAAVDWQNDEPLVGAADCQTRVAAGRRVCVPNF